MTANILVSKLDNIGMTEKTRRVITALAADIEKFIDRDLEIFEWIKTLEALAHLFDNEKATPDEFFQLMNYGSYKECYETFTCDYVIKFCSHANPTIEEINLIKAAQGEGVKDFFIPTLFFKMPREVMLVQMDDYGIGTWDGDEYKGIASKYICIQPLVETSVQVDEAVDNYECFFNASIDHNWNKCRRICGIPVTENANREFWKGLQDACLAWVKNAVSFYGVEKVKEFAQFCYLHGVCDLHLNNVGYDGKRPIVLDWLSFEK